MVSYAYLDAYYVQKACEFFLDDLSDYDEKDRKRIFVLKKN